MSKKALIDVSEIVHTYNDGSVGVRVAEVRDAQDIFETAYIWVDCPDNTIADAECYIQSSATFRKTPSYVPQLDSTGQVANMTVDNADTWSYDWENEYWVQS